MSTAKGPPNAVPREMGIPGTPYRIPEQNAVRAGLATSPSEYPWRSATAHVAREGDSLVQALLLLELVGNWRDFLSLGASEDRVRQLHRNERTARPEGSGADVAGIGQPHRVSVSCPWAVHLHKGENRDVRRTGGLLCPYLLKALDGRIEAESGGPCASHPYRVRCAGG